MDVLAVALLILGLVLLVFGLGAISGWAWAARSLAAPPPRWITAVIAVAGTAVVASSGLRADWLAALASGFFFAMVVAGQLRVGPFRPSGGGNAP